MYNSEFWLMYGSMLASFTGIGGLLSNITKSSKEYTIAYFFWVLTFLPAFFSVLREMTNYANEIMLFFMILLAVIFLVRHRGKKKNIKHAIIYFTVGAYLINSSIPYFLLKIAFVPHELVAFAFVCIANLLLSYSIERGFK